MSARKVHHHHQDNQHNRVAFQEFLLSRDPVYADNHRRLIRQPIAAVFKEIHGRWLLRSSVGRLRRAGVLDHSGKPALNTIGQNLRRAA